MPKLSVLITIHHRVVHAVAVPVEALREVGCLHKGVGREEAANHRVVEASVGVDDVEAVVMFMSGEAAVEGERGLRLRRVPVGVAHAVAPGVEVGLLHGGLALAHHLLPTAQMVGEHVVEAAYAVLVNTYGNDASFGVDVVEPSRSCCRRLNLVEIRNTGLLLDERVASGDHRVPPHARGVIVE